MLHQRTKDMCFAVIAKASLTNYFFRRYLRPLGGNRGKTLHLHVGCGPCYLPGFVNVDANPLLKTDLWLDVRNGLPFRDGSVDSVYCTHVLEHFYPDELHRVASEFARVLKKGAGIRVIVPSLGAAIAAYTKGRADWFTSSFPRRYDSLGGMLSNYLFCDGQHRVALDFGYLEEVLLSSGFSEVLEMGEGRSRLYGDKVLPYQDENLSELAEIPHSLYVEAFK